MQSDELSLHHDHEVKIPRKAPEKLIKFYDSLVLKVQKSFCVLF
jgi:hypothetical protein